MNKKMFGTPIHLHESGIKTLTGNQSKSSWDMMTKARPLDSTHTVDEKKVSALLHEIRKNPPALPRHTGGYPEGPIDVQATLMEE